MNKATKIKVGLGILIGATLLTWVFMRNRKTGEWVELKPGPIQDAIYGLATLESEETFRYRPGVTSQAKRLYVKEGDPVKKGDLLLTLGEGPAIRSPMSGIVSDLSIKQDETFFPNQTLLTVTNLDKMVLTITLEQASAIRVKRGQRVRIQFESLKGKPVEGLVRTLYPKEGQFFIKVDFTSNLPTLLPGMTADTAILAGEKPNALLAPIRAVQAGILTILQDGKKKKVHPEYGFQSSESIEVIPDPKLGIGPGTEVWVNGL
jgi:multidrug efflux pump subunit AcrA (membrane-fusion protein)